MEHEIKFLQTSFLIDILIIGGGPAGYTAAIYGARAELKTVLLTGNQDGGQLMITSDVENYPGFELPITGPQLMSAMRAQSIANGTILHEDHVIEVEFILDEEGDLLKVIATTESNKKYEARSLIIATGAQAKWLGIKGESEFTGFGVSACATCDAMFFKNKTVVVIGGGNTAAEEALYLARHASKVIIIYRGESFFRIEKVLQTRIKNNPKIEVIFDTVVEEICGTESPSKKVTHCKIKNLKTQEITDLKTDGVFVAIGHKPNAKLFSHKISVDNNGYIKTELGSTKTNIPGVFAAGDVQDPKFKQAVTAAGTGCMAALEAMEYLESHLFVNNIIS